MLLSLSAVAMAAFGSVLYYHRQSTQLLLEERQKSARLEIESARKLLGCGSDEILSQERLIFEIQVGDVLTTQTSNWLISSSIEFWDEDEPIYLHILDEGKGPFLLVTKENNEWQHFFLLKVKTPFGFNINLNSVNFSETFFRLARRTL